MVVLIIGSLNNDLGQSIVVLHTHVNNNNVKLVSISKTRKKIFMYVFIYICIQCFTIFIRISCNL